ncbi:MAG: ABC transporter ATP-binding protein [Chloroflexota bacterium]|nr:ABC transporter ATP-binding protein [Chloroflexota bacterium]
MVDVAIHTEQLSRSFGSLRAVEDLSLEVPAGSVFGFLGPNGAGKTTTIHLLLGLLEPSAGRATVLGFDSRTQADQIRARTGSLLEFSGLYERMSAEENLELYGRIYHMPASDRRARVKELMVHLDLWERRRDPVGTWSRGMKQKLAAARALLHHPALIFLDEPTSGLDPVAAAALRDDIAALAKREGVTVFLTTHNLAEAERLCERVGVIRKGKLLALGNPDELRFKQGGPRAEIRGRGFTDDLVASLRERPEVAGVELQNGRLTVELHGEHRVGPLVSLIVRMGGEVEEVHKGAASLEEVFLTLMEEERA